ncbi:MAG: hypothetical protein HOF98_06865 [Gammaproteobacteria bacterium]|jgi:hypothetical protein|nr:hypothetical protein [Gammaproteobacteria bacterium]MBT5941065.1 hypothetical protein [Rhodospirillaceae bacterium]MBT7267211.1 hypothetical protein [Rhodospirillaceae bacterium]
MSDAFKDFLSAMSDYELNALDPSNLDEAARESLAIEIANRKRASETREIEEAIERGSSVQQGNRAPKKFLYIVIGIIAAILFWFFN